MYLMWLLYDFCMLCCADDDDDEENFKSESEGKCVDNDDEK